MKVLQINTVCEKGSTGKIAVSINNYIVEQQSTGMIAFGAKSSSYDYSYKIGGKLNYYYHNIMSRIFGNEGLYSVIATKKLLKFIESYKPDIIHLHNLHGHYINIRILFDYIKLKKIPIIWTFHDCWSFTGKCTHFDYAKCFKWQKLCYKCPQLSSYPASIFDNSKKNFLEKRAVFTGVEKMVLVSPSKWLAELTRDSYLKDYPVKVINNGIDTNIFKPTMFNNEELKKKIEDKYVVLGVSNPWTSSKGFDDFLKIADYFNEEKNIIFIMVGLNDRQLYSMPENVIGLKKTNSSNELAMIYSKADIFINPTYDDNYPTVNLEAVACGTPVITYNTGGSGEFIKEHNAGNVVKKGSFKDLIESIKAYYTKNKKITISKKTIDSLDNSLYKEYLNIYKETLKRN